MSRSAAFAKLAKAAQLSAEAARLYAEAAGELEAEDAPAEQRPISDEERQSMRRRFRQMGRGT